MYSITESDEYLTKTIYSSKLSRFIYLLSLEIISEENNNNVYSIIYEALDKLNIRTHNILNSEKLIDISTELEENSQLLEALLFSTDIVNFYWNMVFNDEDNVDIVEYFLRNFVINKGYRNIDYVLSEKVGLYLTNTSEPHYGNHPLTVRNNIWIVVLYYLILAKTLFFTK